MRKFDQELLMRLSEASGMHWWTIYEIQKDLVRYIAKSGTKTLETKPEIK